MIPNPEDTIALPFPLSLEETEPPLRSKAVKLLRGKVRIQPRFSTNLPLYAHSDFSQPLSDSNSLMRMKYGAQIPSSVLGGLKRKKKSYALPPTFRSIWPWLYQPHLLDHSSSEWPPSALPYEALSPNIVQPQSRLLLLKDNFVQKQFTLPLLEAFPQTAHAQSPHPLPIPLQHVSFERDLLQGCQHNPTFTEKDKNKKHLTRRCVAKAKS